jgi:hypothetical protein
MRNILLYLWIELFLVILYLYTQHNTAALILYEYEVIGYGLGYKEQLLEFI